ncbi:hypothetical protein GCM10010095_81590 [Streptomyces anthocyanicus]|uniref:hypothetical protein n=1 Tax=Streptomyces TaxID=1883 RepID=UPI00166F87DE|nr:MULTISPECIES: hypothetical protein [Streptomyces]GGL84482.1 hypothetical protein GCM10010095_81590 [Streptomyces anthocyanicus]
MTKHYYRQMLKRWLAQCDVRDENGMPVHYARITDQTVRRRWEAATKVNIRVWAVPRERATVRCGGGRSGGVSSG